MSAHEKRAILKNYKTPTTSIRTANKSLLIKILTERLYNFIIVN